MGMPFLSSFSIYNEFPVDRLGKVAQQTRAKTNSEAYCVNVAERWKERFRSFLVIIVLNHKLVNIT